MAESVDKAALKLLGKIGTFLIGEPSVVVIGLIILKVDRFMGNV